MVPRVSVVIPLYNKARLDPRGGRLGPGAVALPTSSSSWWTTAAPTSVSGSWRGVRDGRLRLLRQANSGPGAARNRGLRKRAASTSPSSTRTTSGSPISSASAVRRARQSTRSAPRGCRARAVGPARVEPAARATGGWGSPGGPGAAVTRRAAQAPQVLRGLLSLELHCGPSLARPALRRLLRRRPLHLRRGQLPLADVRA